MDWSSILGSVAGGGVLGLLGNVAHVGLGIWRDKAAHRQRMDEAAAQLELLKVQGELSAAQTAGAIAEARERGAAEAFTASQQAEIALGKATWPWVDAIRQLTRPLLTWMLLAMTGAMAIAEPTLRADLSEVLAGLTVMVVTWWFGQRQLDRSSLTFGNRAASAQVHSQSPR